MSVDSKVNKLFKGKSLMITGGLVPLVRRYFRSFLKQISKDITIFSRDEKKQEDLRLKLNDPKLRLF